jgi:bacterial/archaeal transporter family-2 protein
MQRRDAVHTARYAAPWTRPNAAGTTREGLGGTMNWIGVLLGIAGGMAVGTQAAVNAALGRSIGILETAFISFLVGATILGVMVATAGRGNLAAVTSAPWWQLLGGVLGGFYVFVMVTNVPRMGVAPTITMIIVGQMLAGLLIDHFGWFGVAHSPVTLPRVGAVALMGCALALFFRR